MKARIPTNRLLGAIAALTLPMAANAVPITGEVFFGGTTAPTCGGSTAGCTMDVADGLTFAGSLGGNEFFVTGGTDDFAVIAPGTIGFIDDFSFGGLPVEPLWVIPGPPAPGVFSFDLTSLSVDGQGIDFLNLSGTGIIMSAGFDDTPGTWSLSADDSGGTLSFSFSSNTNAVPEPGVLALLGIGLLGGLVARRRFR